MRPAPSTPVRPLLARALRRGDLVAVPTPASPAPAERLAEGCHQLEQAGFRVRFGPLAKAGGGRFAGDDEARADELNQMLSDPEVRAIVAARGGYGVTRILDRVDFQAIVLDPKVLVGFSDITGLLVAAWQMAGLVGFHGRMAGMDAEWTSYDRDCLFQAITATSPLGRIPHPAEGPPLVTVVPGRAEGRLLGGNLSLLAALSGTPYALDPATVGDSGCILVLEDVREPLYRVDRMLTTLRLAGKFEAVEGVVFGETASLADESGLPTPEFVQLLQEFFAPRSIPCYYGLCCGHGRYHAALPLGVRARMDADRKSLTILEPAMAPN